jgi:hypothetical protein
MDLVNSLKILILRGFTKQKSSYFVDYQLFNTTLNGVLIYKFDLNLIDKSQFTKPLLPDFTKNLDFKNYHRFSTYTGSSFYTFGLSPFPVAGVIFNQSVFLLNDRFSFGGTSFGAQSIFDQPKLNQGIQDMSIRGASMFLQYKVSKNFKVEGRVSISNHDNLRNY